jgi:hypothetical protein
MNVSSVFRFVPLIAGILLATDATARQQPVSWLSGRWAGIARTVDGGEFPVEVVAESATVTMQRGPASAKNPPCQLTIIGAVGKGIRLREENKPKTSCVGDVVILSAESVDRLTLSTYWPDGIRLVATAELIRPASSVPIVLDGDMTDWGTVAAAYRQAGTSARTAHAQVLEARFAADAQNVFVQLSFDRDVNLQANDTAISLLFDVDGDPLTGRTVFGSRGTDLAIDLAAPPGGGIIPRWVPTIGPMQRVSPNEIGFVHAPSYASRSVEIGLRRGLAANSETAIKSFASRLMTASVVLNRDRIARVDYGSGGNIVQSIPAIQIRLPPIATVPPPRATDRVSGSNPLARAARTDFRVVVWNSSGMWLRQGTDRIEGKERFARVFKALDADLLLLDETSSPAAATELEQGLQGILPRSPEWRMLISRTTQRPLIAVRGEIVEAFDRLAYPPEEIRELAKVRRESPQELAEWFKGWPVNAVGARIRLGARTLLVATMDLVSGGDSPESAQEAQRMIEARVIHAAVRGALASDRPDGVLVGGDLNLFATRRPLETLMRGLDRDGADLAPVQALQLNGRAAHTWRSPAVTARFPPAVADWLLYSPSSLEATAAFVFDSSDLSPAWLKELGLLGDDSAKSSDHLPIVVDFRWR